MTIEPQRSWQIDYEAETQEAMVDHLDDIRNLFDHGVLVPDNRLQAIADADLARVAALVSELCDLIESKPVAFNSFQWASRFRGRVLALDALTEETGDE